MDTMDAAATRVYLEGGLYVRVSETISEVADNMSDDALNGWVPVTDPGDGRAKLIRASRVMWVEQEADNGE